MTIGNPVIPTLESTIRILKDRNRQIKYIARQYFTTPRNITNVHNSNEISFTYDVAVAGDDTVVLADRIKISFASVLKRYFPDSSNINVDVEIQFIDDVYYNVVLQIIVSTPSGTFSLNEGFKVTSDGTIIV